jgi:hypothetical protein
MSDLELRLSIAKEIFGYQDISVEDSGDLTVSPDLRAGFFVQSPIRLPSWTRYMHAAATLEDEMRQRQIWPMYQQSLRTIMGKDDVSLASARQRSEAALAAVRGTI